MTFPNSAIKRNIAILGECMIELSGTPFATQQQNFGGDTLNTAIYLSRLLPQRSPSYITALGIDNYSNAMVDAWQHEGIDCRFVMRERDKLPGMYAIEIDPQGERSFLANLKASGCKIAVDSNYRPRLWNGATHAKTWLSELYRLADIALVTADDEDLLRGEVNTSAEVIAERLHRLGVSQVVVKLGSKGAMWSQAGQQGFVDGNQIEHVIDTTAAGDSFNAAYLAAWAKGMPMIACCQWGNNLAAQVIQHRGAVIPQQCTQYLTDLMSSNYDDK
jgi:2-dehydro-3-deoxygluconokinase